MSFTLCTSGAIIAKAGFGASSVAVASGTLLALYSDWAEGRIVAETKNDWVDDYASVDSGVKEALNDCASSIGAMWLIGYDMSGYAGGLAEAETKLDLLRDNVEKSISYLKEGGANKITDIS